MAGTMPDGNLTTELEFLYFFTSEHGPAPEVKAHISILHKAETAAVVLVELEELQGGVGSIDYLSMLNARLYLKHSIFIGRSKIVNLC